MVFPKEYVGMGIRSAFFTFRGEMTAVDDLLSIHVFVIILDRIWSRANDRWFRFGGTGGKSGLHRAGCWVIPSLGDEQESATESKPPRFQRGKGETVR